MARLSEKIKTKELDKSRIRALKVYIPEGHNTSLYISLVEDMMGLDRDGNPRPIDDVLTFLYTCKRTGLDPILKQIHAVYRWNSNLGRETMTIQVGIDGMRLIAERSGKYAGQEEITYYEDGGKLLAATATVLKNVNGQIVRTPATARYSEYVSTKYDKSEKKNVPMGMWVKMPYLMLGKCAEALALRKAFPNELSSVYTPEEMQQADELPTPIKKENPGGENSISRDLLE